VTWAGLTNLASPFKGEERVPRERGVLDLLDVNKTEP
jgi:hypothetical protein